MGEPIMIEELQKVNLTTAADEVVKQIIGLIKEGKIKPGDKLPSELELMKMLNVGRSTIREAKRVLVSKNLLESTPGRGTFIKELDLDEVWDPDVLQLALQGNVNLDSLYEAREILETETSVLAAQRATKEDIRKMEAALERMKASSSPDELYEHGFPFHMAVAKASHNDVLIKIHKIILAMLRQAQPTKYQVDIPEEIRIHTEIFEAVRAHDAAGTRRAIAEHFDYVRKVSKHE
jgi:GntR family transcriptional repressor for pyruvate dehydrogenase complex